MVDPIIASDVCNIPVMVHGSFKPIGGFRFLVFCCLGNQRPFGPYFKLIVGSPFMISYGADRRRIDALQVINGLDCMQLSYILEKLFFESFYFSILRATHLITAGSNVIYIHILKEEQLIRLI